jgi:hypothetical protein
MFEW